MQKYYIHVIAGIERLLDEEGALFVDLKDAIDEAQQSAVELASEELRSGRKFPRTWRMQVIDQSGIVRDTFSFEDLLGDQSLVKPNKHLSIMDSVAVVTRKADRNCKEVREQLGQAWVHLSRLRALSTKFPA
jgi:hypothetical protein